MDLVRQQEEQEHLVNALARSATHGGSPIREFKTHASVILLIGDRAIKIKRAVKFPFLDYSTLQLRKRACEAEFEINKRFAPEIYLGTVPITCGKDGTYQINGDGEIVEWSVSMRRFDENQTLDRLAERGEISETLAFSLADAVLASHRTAPIVETESWLGALHSFIDQNNAAFAARPDLFPPGEAQALASVVETAWKRSYRLLCARGSGGFVRRLHGDLHLGNIVLLDGKPVLFDAIEFDPLVAAGDVLYDLAFLLMDVMERGLPQAANIIFNRYLQRSGEDSHLDALVALPLFISIRAAIRAKVTAARLEGAPLSEWTAISASASRYFKFAIEVLKPVSPKLVAIGGLSGTGKSLLARDIAKQFEPAPGAVILRSDIERKQLFGVAEGDRLPDVAYTSNVGRHVYAVLFSKAKRTLAAGYSVIVDAVFADPSERSQISSCTSANDFHGIFLVTDTNTRASRVGNRLGDVSDADTQVVLEQATFDLGQMDWHQIDASGTSTRTYDAALEALNLKPKLVRAKKRI